MRNRVLARLAWIAVLAAAGAALAARQLDSTPSGLLAGIAVGLLVAAVTFHLSLGRSLRRLDDMHAALSRLAAQDGSAHVDPAGAGPFSDLAGSLNALGDKLRSDYATREQRERLLRTVIDATPMAIVLLEDAGRIVYTNQSARDLFFEGKALEGHNFLTMLSEAPLPFREAVLGNEDSLFTVDVDGEQEAYHLAKRYFEFDGETHALVMVKHLTRELRRQEVDIWKKLIRVISHELNNSLAPITSLVHSARLITQQPEPEKRLVRVFDTIEERAKHLQEFVAGYARFARLPKPRKEDVALPDFLGHLESLVPYVRIGAPPEARGWFDRSQIEQVLINLLKNAQEAGGEETSITLDVASLSGGALELRVGDRGMGMSEEVLAHALLPFYSTKERGTGLGLALCREIVEAHGGKLTLENREGGGVLVTFTLPGRESAPSTTRSKLTLSRM